MLATGIVVLTTLAVSVLVYDLIVYRKIQQGRHDD